MKKSIAQTTFLATTTLLLRSIVATAAPVEGDPAGIEFFEKKIRPLFVEHCYKCHSKDAEKVKGGLLLDTRDEILKGGDTGPATGFSPSPVKSSETPVHAFRKIPLISSSAKSLANPGSTSSAGKVQTR